KQKGDFKIEENEQNSDEIVAHIKLHTRIVKSLEATLVGGQLFVVGTMGAKHSAHQQKRKTYQNSNNNKQQNRRVLWQVHAQLPITISKPEDCSILGAAVPPA